VTGNLFYVDLYNGRACLTAAGDELRFPPVVAGGALRYSLRFLEFKDNRFTERVQEIAALRVGIGPVDQRPASGLYRIKIGTASTQVGVNTTEFLSATSTAADISAALNALSGKASSFVCMDIPGGVLIRRSDGAAQLLTVAANRLVPVSFVRFTGVETDGHWAYELRLTVAPYAFSDSADRVLPNAPTIKTLVNGGADPSNTYFWNEIQEFYVPPTFQGVYQLRYGQYAKTGLLSRDDGPRQIEQAINRMLDLPTGRVGSVVVTNPLNDTAHIEFVGDLAGSDVEELQVVVYSAPPGDWTFELPLDRAELFFALRDSERITVPFEAEADFYKNPRDFSEGTVTRKLWQTTLTIVRPQIMPDMAVAPSTDWLRTNPVTYVPFLPNQVVTGPQSYSTTLGNGSSTEFEVVHGLNGAVANIIVRTNDDEWNVLAFGTAYTARLEDENSLTLEFSAAPPANGIVVTVQGAPTVRDWEPHEHTQEQVVGLKPLLDEMLRRIAIVEQLIPRAGTTGIASGAPIVGFQLPAVGELLPDIATVGSTNTLASQIVVVPAPGNTIKQNYPTGTDLSDQVQQVENSAAANTKDPDALPVGVLYRVLLPGTGSIGKMGQKATLDEKGSVVEDAVPEEPAKPVSWPARSESMLKGDRWPYLLPAIYYGTAIEYNGTTYFGSSASYAAVAAVPSLTGSTRRPKVYQASTPLALPGGGGRKGQNVPANGFFADDGRCLYRVFRDQNTFYPLEMERELWRIMLTGDQFPVGATLTASGEVRIRMLGSFFDDEARGRGRVDYAAQYFLQCEAVPIIASESFLGPAAAPIVLGRTRIGLSSAQETFAWNLSILRESGGMSTSWRAYGKASDGVAFPLPSALRLRLTAFDIDDSLESDPEELFDPRGQIALITPSGKLQIRL
jgi:hypothetical protein